jgi:hypothetical protein
MARINLTVIPADAGIQRLRTEGITQRLSRDVAHANSVDLVPFVQAKALDPRLRGDDGEGGPAVREGWR